MTRGRPTRTIHGLLLLALAAGCDGAGVEGDADGGPGGAGSGSGGCLSNAQCSADNGGLPSLCRNPNAGQACTPLASEHCPTVVGDFQGDEVLVLGLMTVTSGPVAFIGALTIDAATLALDEIAQALPAGLPGADGDHPVVLVVCDMEADPLRAADHLLHTVGVPAILYDATDDQDAEAAAVQLTRDSGTLSLLAMGGAPAALQGDALVWSMVARDAYVLAFPPLLSDLEAALEAELAIDTIRVATVGPDDALAALDASGLVFNGQSPVENAAEGNYTEVSNDGDAAVVAAELAQFAPNVILVVGHETSQWIAALEQSWPAAAPRPRYVFSSRDSGLLAAVAADSADLRTRVRAVELVDVDAGPLFDAFAARYQGVQDATAVPQLAILYDAAYLLPYASVASGQLSQPTGNAIAQGLGALGPPGESMEMPLNAAAITSTLVGGGDVDVVGVTGPLNFDVATRRPARDVAVWCVASGSPPEFQPAGQLYSASTQALEGTYTPCP